MRPDPNLPDAHPESIDEEWLRIQEDIGHEPELGVVMEIEDDSEGLCSCRSCGRQHAEDSLCEHCWTSCDDCNALMPRDSYSRAGLYSTTRCDRCAQRQYKLRLRQYRFMSDAQKAEFDEQFGMEDES